MSFANPQALWLLLLTVIPLLLSRRPATRQRAVSNLYMWRASADADALSLKVRSLRRQWVVAVQMTAIAAIVVALARPTVAARADRIAFVFDVSASMSARDGAATRFDVARDRARSLLTRLSSRTRVRLIAAGATAIDVGEYDASDASLRSALEHLTPTAGAADVPAALLLAAHAVSGTPEGLRDNISADRVIVFTDHVETPGTSGTSVRWEIVGHSADNLALSTLVARRRPFASSDADLLVVVRNYASHPQPADVEISVDGRAVTRRSIVVDKDSEQSVLAGVPRIGRVITARLVSDDALSVDNERREIAAPLDRIRVWRAGRTNVYIDKALTANPAVAPAASFDVADVIVCGCAEPPGSGNVLFVADGGRVLDAGFLAVVKPEHPIASSLSQGSLGSLASLAQRVATPRAGVESGDVIVRAGDAAAVIASERDGRRLVELRFEPTQETAVSTAFPILIANAIRWLDGRLENATQVQAGEPLRWTLPNETSSITVSGPDGKPRAAQVRGQNVTVADTGMPGVYTVRTAVAERLFAVNAAVDSESDLRASGNATPAQPTAGPERTSNGVPLMRTLLLLAATLLVVEWFMNRRRTAWRAAIVACVAIAAAGLAVLPQAASIDAIAVLDRSLSVPPREQQEALARVKAGSSALRRGDRLGVVGFGAEALVESPLVEPALSSVNASAVADTDTDIAKALRLAAAMLSRARAKRIVLFSDGRQTAGDVEREAAFLGAAGVRIDVSPMGASSAARPPTIERVAAPAYARSNEPFAVDVGIRGPADARAEVTLFRDERAIGARQVRVPASGVTSETFTDKQAAGIHVYRVTLKSDQVDDGNSEIGAVASISGEPNVLYISRTAGLLRPMLSGAGFHVTHLAPELVPGGADALTPYDAVVLDDVPAEALGTARAAAIAEYVERAGGGLLLLGSSRTLGIAGYPIGPLGSSLPVDFRRRSGQRAPAFGLVLVFDKSGSMSDEAAGVAKIELARQAVMRVLDVLPPTDSLGVIAFDANPVVVAALAPGQRADDVGKRLQEIVPGGSTRIAPAASLAAKWLNDAGTASAISRRQILLISDGQTSAGDAEQLRAAAAAAGVQVSSVAIGTAANRSLLQQLADSTGGRAYFPDDLAELPNIVAREAARSRSGDVVEETFTLRGSAHPILAGIDRERLPRLAGYVVGAARPTAASVLASHLDDPILSAWQFGLGRVALFTADLGSSWSAPLRAWSDFGRLWVQSARWVSRRVEDRQLRLAAGLDGTALRFILDAERDDGSPIDLVQVDGILRGPDGSSRHVAFEPSAPGRYVARADATSSGAYTVAVAARDREGGADHHLAAGLFRGSDRERAAHGPDDGLLRRVAAATGGRVLAAADNPFAGERPIAYRDVSTWLAAIALLLYLADLLVGPWIVAKWLPHSRRLLRGFVQNRAAA
jgi:Mg-chelatase subunit ChlD